MNDRARHPGWCVRARSCEAVAGGPHASRVLLVPRGRGSNGLRVRLWAIDPAADPAVELEILDTGGIRPWRADLDLTGASALVRAITELVAQAGRR